MPTEEVKRLQAQNQAYHLDKFQRSQLSTTLHKLRENGIATRDQLETNATIQIQQTHNQYNTFINQKFNKLRQKMATLENEYNINPSQQTQDAGIALDLKYKQKTEKLQEKCKEKVAQIREQLHHKIKLSVIMSNIAIREKRTDLLRLFKAQNAKVSFFINEVGLIGLFHATIYFF